MELGDDFRSPLFFAAPLGQPGRADDTRRPLEEMRVLFLRPVRELRQEMIERHAFAPGLTDHLILGLRRAGLADAGENGE
jgi:hypothetical protein